MQITERNQQKKYKKYYEKITVGAIDRDHSLSVMQGNIERDHDKKKATHPAWVIRGLSLRIAAIKELRTELLIHGI